MDINENMIVPEQQITMTWNAGNTEYYKSRGYNYTKQYNTFRVAARDLPNGSQKKIKVLCPICEKQRILPVHKITKKNNTMCGFHSRSKAKTIDETGNRYGRLTVLHKVKNDNYEKYDWKCVCVCGNETTVCGSSLRRGLTKSCGCLSMEKRKERFSGENNWNWNPNREKIRAHRDSIQYKAWNNKIRKRDIVCAICNKKQNGRKQPVHHLYNLKHHKELALVKGNGILLCDNHHIDFHKWVGKMSDKCTPLDFYRYLQDRHIWNITKVCQLIKYKGLLV